MEDFDVFTNEINYTKQFYLNILNKYVNDAPLTPIGPNYQSGHKLLAEECLSAGNETDCAFHFSEAVSASLRTMAVYRDEQIKSASKKLYKIENFIKPVQELVNNNPVSKEEEKLLDFFTKDPLKVFECLNLNEEIPFHKKYLRFGPHNNVDNFQKILKQLPKEWTVVQLTAPYNPNENLKPQCEFKIEINSLYLTMFSNDYLDKTEFGPMTVSIPANVTKEGEKPLFTELFSLLEDNYRTIDNAQFLNSKRLVQNYWSRREDIDLRMKSVINVMDKEWLGGFGSLLTGKLIDASLTDKVMKLVDTAISDWGFVKLNQKQKVLLYNLIGSCATMTSHQIKSCIRRILTEHGNTEEIRQALNTSECQTCTKDFTFVNELCLKCLTKCFEAIHHFTVVDGIKAFSQVATQIKENDEWACMKKAKRYPVILIVDEALDTFPWETLPIINQHPACRVENIHFLYSLYELHARDVIDGYYVTSAACGRYVINPEKNLDRMEKRMSSFVEYWCGGWRGRTGAPPPPDEFLTYLTDADVFLYCGHGDGCHFANGGGAGAGVEGAAGARAVCVLSGCGSVRLQPAPGRAPPQAAHHHLHVAGSPMVVGMLWEVTDLEVDKVVSTLLALCVPSTAPRAWPHVGKQAWSQGTLDTQVESKGPATYERDLLRAICMARASTAFAMIASSVVARGIPVRILD